MARVSYEAMGETCTGYRCDNCDMDIPPNRRVPTPDGYLCGKCAMKRQEAPVNNAGFVKYDAGKPMMAILPWDALEAVARVMTQPVVSKKYSADNWRKCDDPERYESAALRHYAALKKGEVLDPDSGEPHSAAVATNMLFALAIRLSQGRATR